MKTASVHFDTHFHAGEIDRRIFGGFLEHLGRAVYGGVYDPENQHGLSDPATGFRKDVLAALRPLGFPVMRYPGGNYVSAADWRDGIGPRSQRPRRPEYAWKSIETNQFGTDEFMAWCAELGTAPMMAVNLGTAGRSEAAQLLEYCNMPAGTPWADRRVQNGRVEPYGVKIWCLGNEMDGPWQAGHVPADVYALRARNASALMKGLDSTIQTVACGSSSPTMPTYMEWERNVLEQCWDQIDFISAHHYAGNTDNDTPRFLGLGVEIDQVLADYAGVIDFERARRRSKKKIYVCFDEWNVWYKDRGGDGKWRIAPPLLEEIYNFEDALVCAQYLMAFIRRADLVKVACLAQIVNVIGAILTSPRGVLLQSIYHPFAMISAGTPAGSVSLTPRVESAPYTTSGGQQIPTIDAAAAYDAATESVSIFLTNRSLTDAITVTVSLGDYRAVGIADIESLAGFDLKAANSWEKPDQVAPRRATQPEATGGNLEITIPGPGFLTVRTNVARR